MRTYFRVTDHWYDWSHRQPHRADWRPIAASAIDWNNPDNPKLSRAHITWYVEKMWNDEVWYSAYKAMPGINQRRRVPGLDATQETIGKLVSEVMAGVFHQDMYDKIDAPDLVSSHTHNEGSVTIQCCEHVDKEGVTCNEYLGVNYPSFLCRTHRPLG